MGYTSAHKAGGYIKIQETKWADGLRGIAAIGVISSHMCLSFWQQLITPCIDGMDGPPLLFQRPILRLLVQGQSFVALFFILMGFVNSLKPLKQAQNLQIEDALLSLARSALNRSARLVLPASTITVLAWLACQLHLNELARRCDAYWLYHTSHEYIDDWATAFAALKDALVSCWVWGDNPYDQPQWALKWLLIGSFWIFCVLLMTITTRPYFRACVLAAAYFYSWLSADFILGTNIYFGILLAHLHVLLTTTDGSAIVDRLPAWLRYAPFATCILGLYFMSYPSDFAQDAAWSRNLLHLAQSVIPESGDVARFWASAGAQITCASIYSSPTMQRWLSAPVPCYLGGVSFSLYLLHGPLMRSVLAIMVFGSSAMRDNYVEGGDGFARYPIPPRWTFFVTLPVFGALLIACVHAWATKVEPAFARMTKRLEGLATGTGAQRPQSPLQAAIDGKR